MKKVRRMTAILLMMVLVMTAMTACGTKKEDDKGSTSTTGTPGSDAGIDEGKDAGDDAGTDTGKEDDEKKPVTLKTVSSFAGTNASAPVYQAINEEIQKQYDYITISDNSAESGEEWKQTITADFAVGNEPDVLQFFTDATASNILAANKFVTVEEIRSVYPDYAKDTLDSALVAASAPDGTSYAVPTTGYWEGMFCNKDLFDQCGLELPKTWDDLLNCIKVFQENDIVPIAATLNETPHYWIEFCMMSMSGADIYQSTPETAPAEWVQGLEVIKTLKEAGAFPADTDTMKVADAELLFKNKKAAMALDGNWFLSGIPDQENTVVTFFPPVPGAKAPEKASIGGISSGFYITKKAWDDPDKRDAAVKFVMAHTSKAGVQRYWEAAGGGQAAVAVDPMEGMTNLAISAVDYCSQVSSICTPTDSRVGSQAYSTLVGYISPIASGSKSAEEAVNDILNIYHSSKAE